MKLLNCLKCHDIIALKMSIRRCLCLKSAGYYQPDGIRAIISGPCRAIGINNTHYKLSLSTPTIPWTTTYAWFPILSDSKHNVEVVEKID
jgi:hypothetical protein